MKEDNAVKIMKILWGNADDARNIYNSLLGVCFILVVFQGILIWFKYSSGYIVNTIDYMGGMSALLLLIFTYFINIKAKKKREEVHNLYLEMVSEIETNKE